MMRLPMFQDSVFRRRAFYLALRTVAYLPVGVLRSTGGAFGFGPAFFIGLSAQLWQRRAGNGGGGFLLPTLAATICALGAKLQILLVSGGMA